MAILNTLMQSLGITPSGKLTFVLEGTRYRIPADEFGAILGLILIFLIILFVLLLKANFATKTY